MRSQLLLERKIYRQRAKRKRWKSQFNFAQNSKKKSHARKIRRSSNRSRSIKIPEIFSLPLNRPGVLEFFHSLKKINIRGGKYLFFDFSQVREISHGAVTILLSYIGWLNDQGFHASGNYPDDKSSRIDFQRSGFLNFFKTIGTRNYEIGESTIVALGEKRTNSQLSAKLIRKTTKTIWGQEDKNTKIQGMLIELMANTINHAYLGRVHQKGWYFSVDHLTEQNRVKFCFVDNGLGILNTIQKKFKDKIAKFFKNVNAKNIITRAFEGEFGSRTKQSNRGRGLKAIKKVYEQGYIKSLKVITNDVFYDFERNIVEELPDSFDGTFYFWEIDNSCKR